MADDDKEKDLFVVVMNEEQQYSIWSVGLPVPVGWTAVWRYGTKAECLEHIERVWTDMRPLSLRKRMGVSGIPQD